MWLQNQRTRSLQAIAMENQAIQQMSTEAKLVSQILSPNSMVIVSIATNKVIKHMSVDQRPIRHQLLLGFKVIVIHVRSMVIRHKITHLK